MRFPIIAASALLTAACTTTGNTDAGAGPMPEAEGRCSNAALESFVGQKASSDIGARMIAASGARTLRWVAPGMAVTMDYREDRLTVSYDENMVITRAGCG